MITPAEVVDEEKDEGDVTMGVTGVSLGVAEVNLGVMGTSLGVMGATGRSDVFSVLTVVTLVVEEEEEEEEEVEEEEHGVITADGEDNRISYKNIL